MFVYTWFMTTQKLPTIKIIIASTRPERGGDKVAKWLMSLTEQYAKEANIELIDLREVNLPLLDEPKPASSRQYTHEHTKKWAAQIAEADGFVFVHPEYNHSPNAALKNAIDFLWYEWNYKPLALVSYGGGAGGARAAEQLRLTAGGCRMYVLYEQLVFNNYYQYIGEDGKFNAPEGSKDAAHKMLKELIFWTNALREARQSRTQ